MAMMQITEARKPSPMSIVRDILWNRVSKAVWAVLGSWGWIKAFQPPDVQEQLTFYSLLHNAWPWGLWISVVSLALFVLTLYGGVRKVLDIQRKEVGRAGLIPVRDDIRILAAEINQFVEFRVDTNPVYMFKKGKVPSTMEAQVAEGNAVRHFHEANETYLQRFAPRVALAREQLTAAGIFDPELDDNYLKLSIDAYRTVAGRLNFLAERLPASLADAHKQLIALQSLPQKIAALEREAPRRLTSEQKRIIISHLQPLVKLDIANGKTPQIAVHHMDCADCAEYALEFEKLFQSLGFQLVPAQMKQWMTDKREIEDYRIGIYVRLDTAHSVKYKIPAFGEALYVALTEADIKAERLDRPGVSLDELIIGARQRAPE
jgi:hypothetical protein